MIQILIVEVETEHVSLPPGSLNGLRRNLVNPGGGGGGGGLPYKKGRDARQEISNELLKDTNLGVA